jgi:hypothetical protein
MHDLKPDFGPLIGGFIRDRPPIETSVLDVVILDCLGYHDRKYSLEDLQAETGVSTLTEMRSVMHRLMTVFNDYFEQKISPESLHKLEIVHTTDDDSYCMKETDGA